MFSIRKIEKQNDYEQFEAEGMFAIRKIEN